MLTSSAFAESNTNRSVHVYDDGNVCSFSVTDGSLQNGGVMFSALFHFEDRKPSIGVMTNSLKFINLDGDLRLILQTPKGIITSKLYHLDGMADSRLRADFTFSINRNQKVSDLFINKIIQVNNNDDIYKIKALDAATDQNEIDELNKCIDRVITKNKKTVFTETPMEVKRWNNDG